MKNKRISLAEAVTWVKPGNTLALGGLTLYRRPVAFVRELIKAHRNTGIPGNLTLLTLTAGFESDLMVGERMVSSTRTCYFGLEIFGLAPMYTHYANLGQIKIIEETEASLAFGIRAQMANVGFMPARAWLGTDLPALRPDVRTVIDPYNGEELIAFPAIQSDVAVIHALRADRDGNAQIGKNKGIDMELPLISSKVILTAEEIVDRLDQADIFGIFVDGVVHVPRGAAPTSCHPLYALEGLSLLDYTTRVTNPESFESFMGDWLKED